MDTFASIIELWPRPHCATYAADVGVTPISASSFKRRGIPAKYWAATVAAAGRRGIAGVTAERLAMLAAAGHSFGPQANSSTSSAEEAA